MILICEQRHEITSRLGVGNPQTHGIAPQTKSSELLLKIPILPRQILDIVPEGVSMAITFRSEYGSFVKANGGDLGKLIETLRQKLASGAFRPASQ